MNYMTNVAFLIVKSSLVALLVVGTEDMGSGHTVFANRDSSGHVTNRGINVQTDTNQDQGCEGSGGTSGITNACTATSGSGSTETSTQTSVTLRFEACVVNNIEPLTCNTPIPPEKCNNIGCQSLICTGPGNFNPGTCTTNNGVQLTSCTIPPNENLVTCTLTETHTVPGTSITQSGGVTGG